MLAGVLAGVSPGVSTHSDDDVAEHGTGSIGGGRMSGGGRDGEVSVVVTGALGVDPGVILTAT